MRVGSGTGGFCFDDSELVPRSQDLGGPSGGERVPSLRSGLDNAPGNPNSTAIAFIASMQNATCSSTSEARMAALRCAARGPQARGKGFPTNFFSLIRFAHPGLKSGA